MAYGIDQMVQDKTDAYRGNPAALQKRSAMSKELIDMLALQKITSEKDAAARDMQLKMEQQPGTIAQQLEQKAVGQTKDEMLKGVAGVMQTNQAKQQANMQRAASAGIAGQPRPNMQMMAQGGVVGYAPGGEVQEKSDKIAEIRARTDIDESVKYQMIQALLGEQGYKDPATLDDDAAKVQKVRAARDMAGDPKAMNPALGFNALKSGPTKTVGGGYKDVGAMNVVTQGMKGNALGTGALQGEGEVPDPMGPIGDDMMRGLGGPAIEPPAGEPPVEKASPELDTGLGSVDTNVGGIQTVPGMTVTAPTARTKDQLLTGTYSTRDDYKDLTSTKEGIAGAKKLIDNDPSAMRDDAMKFGLDKLGITDARRDAETKRQDALKALNKRQMAGNTNDQLLAYLQGVSQSGSLGGGLAGLRNTRGAQQKDELARLTNEQGAERAFEGKEQEIKIKAFDFAKDAFKIAQENIRSGASTMATFNATEQRGLSEDTKNLLSRDATNLSEQSKDRRLQLDTAVANASNLTKIAVGNASDATKRSIANAGSKVKISIANLEASLTREKNALEERLKTANMDLKDKQAGAKLLADTQKYIAEIITKTDKIYLEMEETLKYSGLEGDVLKTALKELNARKVAGLEISIGQMRLDVQTLRSNLSSVGGTTSTTAPSGFGQAKAKAPTGP